jgi:hypothetical protein
LPVLNKTPIRPAATRGAIFTPAAASDAAVRRAYLRHEFEPLWLPSGIVYALFPPGWPLPPGYETPFGHYFTP